MVATDATNEQLLIEYAACGAPEAFNELYRRCAKYVRHFIFKIVRRHHLAEDISQQAWLNVSQQAKSFKADSRAITWLCAVGKHAAISHRRKASYSRELQASDVTFRLAAGGYDEPACEVARQDDIAALKAALSQLRREQVMVIQLLDLQELDYTEAAQILQVPVGTVRSRRHRAIAKLKQHLAA